MNSSIPQAMILREAAKTLDRACDTARAAVAWLSQLEDAHTDDEIGNATTDSINEIWDVVETLSAIEKWATVKAAGI